MMSDIINFFGMIIWLILRGGPNPPWSRDDSNDYTATVEREAVKRRGVIKELMRQYEEDRAKK